MHYRKHVAKKTTRVPGLIKKTIMLWPEQLPMLSIVDTMPVRKPMAKRFCILP